MPRFRHAIMLAMIACASLRSGNDRPTFTGTWVLNHTRSQLQVPTPDSTIFAIQHDEPIVRIFRTHARAGGIDTVTLILRADSTEVAGELRGARSISRVWWEGRELVFAMTLSRGDQRASQVVRYSLSDGRRTFTAVEAVDGVAGSHLNRWVFDRRR